MSTFYVNISNNTSADTLLALGWAALLDDVCTRLGIPVVQHSSETGCLSRPATAELEPASEE